MRTRLPISGGVPPRGDAMREAGFRGALQTRVPFVASLVAHAVAIALIVWTTRLASPSPAIPPKAFSMLFEPVAAPAPTEPAATLPSSTEIASPMEAETDLVVPTPEPPAFAPPPAEPTEPAPLEPPQTLQPQPPEPMPVPAPPLAQQEPPPEPPPQPVVQPPIPSPAPSSAKPSQPHQVRRLPPRPQEPAQAPGSSVAPLLPGSAAVKEPAPALPSRSPVTPTETSPGWRSALSAWLQAHRAYPDAARSRSEEGTVVLRFTVGRDGVVLGVTLVRSSGSDTLDEAAQAIFRNAHVPVFTADMTQAQTMVTVPIHYRLER